MRNLIAPAALVAGLVLSSAAFAAADPNSSSAAPSPPVVQEHNTGRVSEIGAPIDRISASPTVSYAGLNLSSPAGEKTLDHRIDAAATRTCAALKNDYPPSIYPSVSGDRCVAAAEHRANAAVESQMNNRN
jgi:UrcA family protein